MFVTTSSPPSPHEAREEESRIRAWVAIFLFIVFMTGATVMGYLVGLEHCKVDITTVQTGDLPPVTTSTFYGSGCDR